MKRIQQTFFIIDGFMFKTDDSAMKHLESAIKMSVFHKAYDEYIDSTTQPITINGETIQASKIAQTKSSYHLDIVTYIPKFISELWENSSERKQKLKEFGISYSEEVYSIPKEGIWSEPCWIWNGRQIDEFWNSVRHFYGEDLEYYYKDDFHKEINRTYGKFTIEDLEYHAEYLASEILINVDKENYLKMFYDFIRFNFINCISFLNDNETFKLSDRCIITFNQNKKEED